MGTADTTSAATQPAAEAAAWNASLRTEFREACEASVARTVPVAAGLVGAFFVLAAFSHPFVVPPHATAALTALAAGSALVLLCAWVVLRRRPLPLRAAHPAMMALWLVALANTATHLILVPEPRQSTNFLILIAGCGFLLLSRPWLVAALATTLASWSVLAWTAPSDPNWIHFAYAVIATTVLSLAVHEMRLRSTGRFVRLMHLAERRAAELAVRRRVETELRARELRLARFNAVLLQLAKSQSIAAGDLDAALREITEQAAGALDVARVGVFFYDDSRTRIVGADLYDRNRGEHERGLELESQQYPRYFASLDESRSLVSHDVRNDPRTNEFWNDYLEPQGITSMIDTAIYFRGETVGVICHEHVGPVRRWTPEEAAFAGSVADFVALALEARERSRQERERRELERRMQDAQRLESLGVLAGGIAHDFNNLLTAILGSAELALLDLPAGSDTRAAVERVKRAGRRAAELTGQMLAYSGRSRVDVKPINLSALMEEMSELLQSGIRKDARLCIELDHSLPPVQGDPSQLGQIVMNLITNASDALGESGGEIRMRTGVERLDRAALEECELRDIEPGDYVFLEVSDSGAGMDAHTRAHLFDPFFTTKASGRGLGLAAALGIVAAHRGTIRLDTAPGRGTTFRAFLPRAEAAASAETPGEEPHAVRWQAQGTVLMVDDEEEVCQVAKALLERAGLRVLAGGSGTSAIEMLRAHASEVDVAVVDLTMPDLDGAQVTRRLHEIRPGLPVILSSGYDRNEVRPHAASDDIVAFVHKPYTRGELLGAVQAALEAGDSKRSA